MVTMETMKILTIMITMTTTHPQPAEKWAIEEKDFCYI